MAEEISEVDGLLNFYLETSFDVDAVFGTQVCTTENDDGLNVYANYDMASGQVCDELEIALHRGDGSETALSYHLNAAEKEVLLRKMETTVRNRRAWASWNTAPRSWRRRRSRPPGRPCDLGVYVKDGGISRWVW